MRLNELTDNPGARKFRTRVGRGIGSGLGKTAGRGGKGQTARTGVAINGFEGGQMPLHRRLPKRGFNKYRPNHYNEINVGALQQAVDEGKLKPGQSVDVAALIAVGIVRRPLDGLRVLGDGEIKTPLKLTANHASAKARTAIEAAGGAITLIVKKILPDDVAKAKKTAAKKAAAGKPVKAATDDTK